MKHPEDIYRPSGAQEPSVSYSLAADRQSLLQLLLQGDISSRALFSELLRQSGMTIQSLAKSIFEITPKTFIKYKNTEVQIPSRIAELALELIALYELGNELFGDSSNFNQWLDTESPFFDKRAPRQYMNTSTGIRLIQEELKRIEFGATA